MDPFDLVVQAALLGIPVAYLLVQIRAASLWRGGLRWAALLPLALWAVWIVVLVLDLSRDPTSHNLFPFEILIGALLSLSYLACLGLVRLMVR
jgi:hypothetical protein